MGDAQPFAKIPVGHLVVRFRASPTPGDIRRDACYLYIMAMLAAQAPDLLALTIDKIATRCGISWRSARTATEEALADTDRLSPSPFVSAARAHLLRSRGVAHE